MKILGSQTNTQEGNRLPVFQLTDSASIDEQMKLTQKKLYWLQNFWVPPEYKFMSTTKKHMLELFNIPLKIT